MRRNNSVLIGKNSLKSKPTDFVTCFPLSSPVRLQSLYDNASFSSTSPLNSASLHVNPFSKAAMNQIADTVIAMLSFAVSQMDSSFPETPTKAAPSSTMFVKRPA
jgi:hypothetical protein